LYFKCCVAEVAALCSYSDRRLKCWKYVQACLVMLVCLSASSVGVMVTPTNIITAAVGASSGSDSNVSVAVTWQWQ
jgi:hypothetical protein